MDKTINLALIGASGVVGQKILQLLEKKHFKINKLFSAPHHEVLMKNDTPKYIFGDYIIHYVGPLTLSQKENYARSFKDECFKIWENCLPSMETLEENKNFLKLIIGI